MVTHGEGRVGLKHLPYYLCAIGSCAIWLLCNTVQYSTFTTTIITPVVVVGVLVVVVVVVVEISLVITTLHDRSVPQWTTEVQRHGGSIPYGVFQKVRSCHLQRAKQLQLSWDVQCGLRSWCRFRAGAILLAGKSAAGSRARFKPCLFCGMLVRNEMVHCLAQCSRWAPYKESILSLQGLVPASADETARCVLQLGPGSAAFPQVVLWFKDVDIESTRMQRQL